MHHFVHRGIVKDNGLVDTAQTITDAAQLKIVPADDGYHLGEPVVGNFEWWYFDVMELGSNRVARIVAHLGTDPLRRIFYPQLAVSIMTPRQKRTITKRYAFADFHAATDSCDVKLGDDFHVCAEPTDRAAVYRVAVRLDTFQADLQFVPTTEGWNPLGGEVRVEKGGRNGSFFWIVPVPRADVVGDFTVKGEVHHLEKAVGYHDHNYWKVGARRKLFMDDILSKWYWGKIVLDKHTSIFMDMDLRGRHIRSFMLAKGESILESSNNLIEVIPSSYEEDSDIRTPYPTQIAIRSAQGEEPFEILLRSKECIERKDLLDGVNPLFKWLIRSFVARPAYYGFLASATVTMRGESRQGAGIYEMMLFRT